MVQRPHEVPRANANCDHFVGSLRRECLTHVLVIGVLPLIGPERAERFKATAQAAREQLAGRVVLNVNSTASGGGVAEMLRTLLAYARGAGVDTQWIVIQGDPHFFEITKRIHNNLHGAPGDGGLLGDDERRHYEEIVRANADELLALVRPRDIVLLHDPQTAGLAQALARAGVIVVWRCHVGADVVNAHTERAWAFLRPYLDDVDAYVFSRAAYAPDWADPRRTFVIPPSIDPFSAKNQPMSPADVEAVLHYVGLLAGEPPAEVAAFMLEDGSIGRINRHVDVLQTGPPPPAGAPLVVQVSRWDPLKDMAGVMTAFAEDVAGADGLAFSGVAFLRGCRRRGERRDGQERGSEGEAIDGHNTRGSGKALASSTGRFSERFRVISA